MCFYVLVLRVTCHTGVSVYNVVPCLMRYMFVPCLMYPHSCTMPHITWGTNIMPHITWGTNIMWYEALYMTPVKQCLIWSHVQCLISHEAQISHEALYMTPIQCLMWYLYITWGIVYKYGYIYIYIMRHCVQIYILCTNIYLYTMPHVIYICTI